MDTENYMMSFMMHLLCKWHHAYNVLTLSMMSTDSAALVWTHEKDKLFLDYKGRARGLMSILEEERQRCNRLWVTTCLTPRHGWAETLALLTKMVSKNDMELGHGRGQSQTLGRWLSAPNNPNSPCNLEPVRTQGKNTIMSACILAQVSGQGLP